MEKGETGRAPRGGDRLSEGRLGGHQEQGGSLVEACPIVRWGAYREYLGTVSMFQKEGGPVRQEQRRDAKEKSEGRTLVRHPKAFSGAPISGTLPANLRTAATKTARRE